MKLDDYLAENGIPRVRFAHFPFGGGEHQCIGEGFAGMKAKIALATLCQH